MEGTYKHQEREFKVIHHPYPYTGYYVTENDNKIGTIHITYHPTIPFEAFTPEGSGAKRVNTIEEAIKFLTDEHTNNSKEN